MERKDGGCAFPNDGLWANGFPEGGMSLRDWFAGQALIGITSALHQGIRPADVPAMASDCYGIADAMIAARPKEQQ